MNSQESTSRVWKLMDEMKDDGFLEIPPDCILHDLDFTTDHPKFVCVLKVYCYTNQLTTLPLWPSVKTVDCSDNQLTTLPLWPNIKEVYCDTNQLTTLPLWPSVELVSCCNNQLTTLPLWSNIKKVYCHHNPLPYNHKKYLSIHAVSCPSRGDHSITR